MLNLSELVRIYVGAQPTDMRKGFDTLAAVVRDWLGGDPLSGICSCSAVAAAIASSCSFGTRTDSQFFTSV